MMKVKGSLGFAVLVFLAACDRLETMENVYPNVQAAIDAGAIERGWIPRFLPPSAKEIREKHNVDTNEVWLHFSLESGELGSIEKSCRPIKAGIVPFPKKRGGVWWPEALVEKQADTQWQANGYTYYRCENGGSVAVAVGDHSVFYWHFNVAE